MNRVKLDSTFSFPDLFFKDGYFGSTSFLFFPANAHWDLLYYIVGFNEQTALLPISRLQVFIHMFCKDVKNCTSLLAFEGRLR